MELMSLSGHANAGIVWIEPLAKSYELSLPGKLFEYVQCGLPVLGTPLPEIKRHVTDYNLGVVSDGFTKVDFQNAVKKLQANITGYKLAVELAKDKLCFENERKILKGIIQSAMVEG